MARRPPPHPRRPAARRAGATPPTGRHRTAVVDGQSPCGDGAVPAADLDRERLDRRVRAGPVRQRGPRATRGCARRQHLCRGHRPVQPGRGSATRLVGRRQPESAVGRAPTTRGAGHRNGRDQPDLRRAPRRHGIVDRRHRRRDHRGRGPGRDRMHRHVDRTPHRRTVECAHRRGRPCHLRPPPPTRSMR